MSFFKNSRVRLPRSRSIAFIIERLSQGRTIVRASSTAPAGRFISRGGLIETARSRCFGALCNGVEGTGEQLAKASTRPFSSTTNYRWRTSASLYSIIVNSTRYDQTTLFPSVFSVALKLYKPKLKADWN